MMSSMPKGLTAATGMDALTHAIEGYTTLAAWELADTLNLKAIELIAKNLRKAVANDPDGREGMALGQYVTGMAFPMSVWALFTAWLILCRLFMIRRTVWQMLFCCLM